jgi:RNA polymerase sporulation-specific sigma factor
MKVSEKYRRINLPPRLSEAEKHDLFAKWKAGDVAARDALVLSHTRLALHMARGFEHRADVEDLFQVAVEAICETLDRYDPNRGHMGGLLSAAIKRALLDYVSRQTPVTIPSTSYRLAALVGKPDKIPGLTEYTSASLLRAAKPAADVAPASSDDQMEEDEGHASHNEPIDPAPTVEELFADAEMQERLTQALATLNEREQLVIRRRFFEGAKLADVARELRIKEASSVCRIVDRALHKLRKQLTDGE